MSLVAKIVLERLTDKQKGNLSPAILTYSSNYEKYPTFLQVIEELCKDSNIYQMLYASDCHRPAVEPIIRNIENICRTSLDFDIFSDAKAKQSLGIIVKIIMGIYNYELIEEGEKNLLKGYSESIKSAAVYAEKNNIS